MVDRPTPQTRPAAGGFLIATGAIGGAVIGLYTGEPTRGFLIGIAGGAAIALAIWLLNLRN